MSDTTNAVEDSENESDAPKKNFRRELEERATAAEAKAAELERKLAFNSVPGLDLSQPAHKFFAENYKGDLDPAEVAKAATEMGFITPKTETSEVDADVQRIARFDAASQGAEPATISGTEAAKQAELLDKSKYNSSQEFLQAAYEHGYANNPNSGDI